MRAVLQRVSRAQVRVGGEIVGQIGSGLVVLLGVAQGDTHHDVQQLADRCLQLRIFDDAAGKMNHSLLDLQQAPAEAQPGQGATRPGVLVVSQFTLLADCRKGRRPSFVQAAPPELAEQLYEAFVAAVGVQGVRVATGRFRAAMEVELVNDGPVTIVLDTREGR